MIISKEYLNLIQTTVWSQIDFVWEYIVKNQNFVCDLNSEYLGTVLKYSYELEELQELRVTYPELNFFNDSTLYYLYDLYQYDWNAVSGWDVDRDNLFAIFILQHLSVYQLNKLSLTHQREKDREEDMFFGQVIIYYLLKKKTWEDSVSLAQKIDIDKSLLYR
ncbi:MAG: hypothetical protein KME09_07265 [Pleurocapsa minor HA4230-MV1]|jgi:hypothetical protein|nr:hypothetical protein [Pleurocapsa minor HA4230-MV1]